MASQEAGGEDELIAATFAPLAAGLAGAGSGMPDSRTASTSTEYTASPPVLMTSFLRSTMST